MSWFFFEKRLYRASFEGRFLERQNGYLLPRGDSWTWNPHLSDPAIIPVELSSHVFGWYIFGLSFENSWVPEKRRTGHLRPNGYDMDMTLGFPNIPYYLIKQLLRRWSSENIHGCDLPQVVFQVAFGRDPTRSALSTNKFRRWIGILLEGKSTGIPWKKMHFI